MKEQIRQAEVKNKFHFGFTDYDPELESAANLKLIQLLAFAPPSATGVGLVEKSEREFLATISIQSPFRSFAAKAISTNPESAVKKSLERMEENLFRWKFGSGSGNNGRQTGIPSGTQMPLAGSR